MMPLCARYCTTPSAKVAERIPPPEIARPTASSRFFGQVVVLPAARCTSFCSAASIAVALRMGISLSRDTELNGVPQGHNSG